VTPAVGSLMQWLLTSRNRTTCPRGCAAPLWLRQPFYFLCRRISHAAAGPSINSAAGSGMGVHPAEGHWADTATGLTTTCATGMSAATSAADRNRFIDVWDAVLLLIGAGGAIRRSSDIPLPRNSWFQLCNYRVFLQVRILGTRNSVQRSARVCGRPGKYLAAMLLAQILPVFSFVAPCQSGSSLVSVRRATSTTELLGYAALAKERAHEGSV
jgi:hypothetical protein